MKNATWHFPLREFMQNTKAQNTVICFTFYLTLNMNFLLGNFEINLKDQFPLEK